MPMRTPMPARATTPMQTTTPMPAPLTKPAVAMRTLTPTLRGLPATTTPTSMPMGLPSAPMLMKPMPMGPIPMGPMPMPMPMPMPIPMLMPMLMPKSNSKSKSTPPSKLASMALARATVAAAPTGMAGAVVGGVGLAEPGAMVGASTSCGNHVNSFQNEFGASFRRMPVAHRMPSGAPATHEAFATTAAAPTQDLRTRRQPHISGFAAQTRDDRAACACTG
jgi:hypothetical protein